MCLALLDLSDRLVISVFGQDFLDAFYRVQEFADGIVVIQGTIIAKTSKLPFSILFIIFLLSPFYIIMVSFLDTFF